ncbi:hypothetical protein C7Y47_15610 [Lysinibacillus sphaericus]|uniref:Matrixin family metalloprotease n=1 Tax=Lysinibacillus sphaericus TaxID=1421 RepID=A0A544UDT3_LYSSH|nr:hypothetical protein [Lysinibacillus sp. SDF0037]TQR30554.1 hypothetical protein C7Y47_15610 [Lysinibacillus sp. SDF0037]
MYFFCLTVLFCFQVPEKGRAYELNSKKFKNPKDAFYWIDPTFDKYNLGGEVKEGILAWNALPEIKFTKKVPSASGVEVSVEYLDKYNGNLYGQSFGSGRITIYKKWREELGSTRRIETIVHEVGHEAGLGHTQKKNDGIAVMRELDFNDKAYPLKDDKDGIAKKY